MTEKAEAKRMGAKLQPNSGRGAVQKGDMTLGPFLIDLKEYSKSFGVSVKNWAKLCTDAYKAGSMEPAFKLVLEENGRKVRVWVVSEHIIEHYVELLQKEQENML